MLPGIYLRHRDFMQGTSVVCNNDDVVLHIHSIQVEGNDSMENNHSSYTSQLNITYSTSLFGSTVVCAYDNGTEVTIIGSRIVTSNTKCMHSIIKRLCAC